MGRKLTPEDVQFLKETYHQLHGIEGHSIYKSLKIMEEKHGIPHNTAYDHLFVFPNPEIHEKQKEKRRESYARLKVEEPGKYKDFLKKNREYKSKLKEEHPEEWEIYLDRERKRSKKWYKNIRKDPKKLEEWLEKHREQNKNWYRKLRTENPTKHKEYLECFRKTSQKYREEIRKDPKKLEEYLKKAEVSYKKFYRKKQKRIKNLTERIENINGQIITREELDKAIAYYFRIRKWRDFIECSDYVLNLFGFDDRLIDNILGPEDRQLFNIYAEAGFVKPITGEEISIEEDSPLEGEIWTVYEWELCKKEILEATLNYEKTHALKPLIKPKPDDVYDSDEIWTRGTPKVQV